MIPSPTASASLVAGYSHTAKRTLIQRLVLDAFAALSRGHLRMELPEGTVHDFGDLTHPLTLPHSLPDSATIRVRNSAFFEKCFWSGDIGFAESYLDGDWDTPHLPAVIAWFIANVDHAPMLSGSRQARSFVLNALRFANRLGHLLRPNSRRIARRNISEHYDLSNAFFALWLDPSMMYSSARWTTSDATLESAQRAKNEALCRSLRLKATDHVLEIGSGWGGWAIHAASRHGCRITSITLSQQQLELARNASLPPT